MVFLLGSWYGLAQLVDSKRKLRVSLPHPFCDPVSQRPERCTEPASPRYTTLCRAS